MLNEQDATTLLQAYDGLPGDQQAMAKAKLQAYHDHAAFEGFDPYPSNTAAKAKAQGQYQSMFVDLKNVDAINPTIGQVAPMLADADSERAAEANRHFLARKYNIGVEELRNPVTYQLHRDHHATTAWADFGAQDDKSFYAGAKKEVGREKDTDATRAWAQSDGAMAAASGDPSGVKRLGEWKAQAETKTGWESAHTKAWLDAYQHVDSLLAPYRPLIANTVAAMAKTMEGVTSDEEAEKVLRETREALIDMPGEQRRAVLAAMMTAGAKRGEATGKAGFADLFRELGKSSTGGSGDTLGAAGSLVVQAGESLGRMVGDMASDLPRRELALESVAVDGEVMTSVREITTPEQARAYVAGEIARAQSLSFDTSPGSRERYDSLNRKDAAPLKLTPEATRLIMDAKARALRTIKVERELDDISNMTDPIKSVVAGTAGSSIGIMGALAVAPEMAIVLAAGYANSEFEDLSRKYPTMSANDKMTIASISGPAQAALDFVQLGALKRLPSLSDFITKGITRSMVGGALAQAGKSFAVENLVELGQDYSTPIIQGLASSLSRDIPGVDWGMETENFWKGRADVALGMLPLTLIGLGHASVEGYARGKSALQINQGLGEAGYVETDRITIADALASGDTAKAQAAIQDAFGRRSPEIAAEFGNEAQASRVAMQRAVADAEARGMLPRWRRDGQGFSVSVGTDTIRVDSMDQVQAIAMSHLNEWEKQQQAAVASIAGELLDRGTTAEAWESAPSENRKLKNEAEQDGSLDNVLQAARVAAQLEGVAHDDATALERSVVGSNRAEMVEAVRTLVSRGFQQASVLTPVEEFLEGRVKLGLSNGTFTAPQLTGWVRSTEAATGLSFLGDEASFAARSEGEQQRLVLESISKIVIADVVASDAEGKHFAPGLISRGLKAQHRGYRQRIAEGQADMNAAEVGKFRHFLRLFREMIGAALRTAKAVALARKEGKLGEDHDAFVDALLGANAEQRFASEVERQANGLLEGLGEETQDYTSFSISSADLRTKLETAPDVTTLGALGITEGFHANDGGLLSPSFEPRVSRQSRGGRHVGFYMAPDAAGAEKYGGNLFTFPLAGDTRVAVLRRPGQVERITVEQRELYRADGIHVVVGPAIISSRIEIAVLDEQGLGEQGELGFEATTYNLMGLHGAWISSNGEVAKVNNTYGHADVIEPLAKVKIKTPEDYEQAYSKGYVRLTNTPGGVYATYGSKPFSGAQKAALEMVAIETGKTVYRDTGAKVVKLYEFKGEGASYSLVPATAEDRARLGVPPAWVDVVVDDDPSAAMLAKGKDDKGRWQSIYSSAHSKAALAAKFARGKRINSAMEGMVASIEAGVTRGDEEAAVLRLIYLTGFRNGGEGDTGAKVKAYGATTLLADHVTIDGDTVYFDFIGKLGVEQKHSVKHAGLAADLQARKTKGGRLFDTSPDKVLSYLRKVGENDFKVHDLRTWNATELASRLIEGEQKPADETSYWLKRDAIADVVARKLGDTRKIVLESYIDPIVFAKWRYSANVLNEEKPKLGKKVITASGEAGKLGRSQEAYANALRDEFLPPSRQGISSFRNQGLEQGAFTFSLSPAKRMELVENRLAIVLNQDSEQARKFAERANDRLAKLKNRYAGVPAPKSKAELDKQQRGMVESRRVELEDELVGEIEHRLGGVHDLVTKLREHDLADGLIRPDFRRKRLWLGKLLSPSKWRARFVAAGEPIPGDYDGIDGIPRMFFMGDTEPDQVDLRQLQEDGLIDEATPKGLWEGVNSMLNELATNKEQWANYKQQLTEARQQAKEEAEYEGRAWRAEEDELQAALANPRQAAMRDVATLEAVIMAMPMEARAKLPKGLSAMVAGVTTDRAFADMMTKAVRAVDKALNDYWKAKNIESMNDLVMLGQGKTSPGKKPRGTATPAVHRYFSEVAKVVAATPSELAVLRLGIVQTLEADEVAVDEIELTQRLNVIDTWGGFEGLSVKDQTAALENGWETYRAGRNAWWQAEEARLIETRENAQTVLDAGGTGTTGQMLRTRAKRGQVLSAVGGTFVDVGQFMKRLIGDIPLVQQWERRVANAFIAKEQALGKMRRKWDAALETAMPARSKSQRERRFFEMHTKRSIVVELTEEKMNALLNAKQRDELQETGWTPEQITDTATMTEAEAMTVLLTWEQPRYRASLERSGFTAGVVSKLREALSNEAKSLSDWMRDELQAQHAPLNAVFQRMAGIDLPNTPNYWPGRFYSAGTEQEVDVMGQGVVGKGFADGFLKERKNHAAYVKLENAFATFWAHINQSEHWRNLAEPVREMRGVFRNPQVKRGVESSAGKQALNDMNAWLDVLEANGTQGDSGAVEKVLSRWLGNFSLGRLAWNPFSVIRQAPAMFNVGLDAGLTPGMLFKGAGSILRNPSNFLDIYNELFASDVIFARLEGGMSPEVRNALNEFWKSGPGMWKGSLDKGMEALGYTDALFTTIGGVVAYESKAIELERAGLTPEEAHVQAMAAARDAMEATAQPTTVNRKSLMEARSQNAIKKSVMMFLSDGRQKWAFYQESVRDVLANAKTPSKIKRESWNRLLWTWLVIGPASQILTSAIRDSMDGGDDDEVFDAKNWAVSDFVISSLLGPLRGFFFAGQIVETMADRAAGRKVWESSAGGVTDIPEEVGGDILRAAGYVFDEKDQSAEQYGKLALNLMSNVGGVPGMVAGTIKKAFKLADQD